MTEYNLGLLLFYGLVGGLFSLIGGFILLWKQQAAQKLMTPLLSFAAGAFLGGAFLNILPEALAGSLDPRPILIATLAGFLFFFILERFLMRYFYYRNETGHEHQAHTESLPFLIILGDSLHNFLDGILIAITYLVSPALGLATTLAVAAHEIPQEIGDFSVLLSQGWPKGRIIAVNISQSLLTIPGILLGFYGGTFFEPYLPYSLAVAAGILLYLGASDLIPELHHRGGHRQIWQIVLSLLASVVMIGYLTSLAYQS